MMKRLLSNFSYLVITLIFFHSGNVNAFDEADVKKLETTGSCVGCDLVSTFKIHFVGKSRVETTHTRPLHMGFWKYIGYSM